MGILFFLGLLLILNYHIPSRLKLGLEVAREKLQKKEEWEFRVKGLRWKCEEGGSKDQKARTGGGEHQSIREKQRGIVTQVPSSQCQCFLSAASLPLD